MLAFVSDLKKPTDIVNIDELVAGLKAKHGEYARMNNKHLEKQTQHFLDSHFADVNETNIRKQFYKKKDLFKQTEESGEELPDVANNEELVEHKSANMLNNMLPIMTTLGKRTATNDGEGLPEKRKKLASIVSFTKDKMAAQAAEEMLNKYLVEPSVKYSDIGGLDSVIKQLREMIEWPLKYSDIFQFLGVKPPKGILISGPPGTGKT